MYPYVEQLLRWKAGEEDKKVGGLVLEIEGDFCVQVESILARANRPNDYIEIGLDTGYTTFSRCSATSWTTRHH
jgi:hypothetical protein